jgi:hypothetical protein
MATITATVARAMQATYNPTTTITKVQSYVTSASLSVGDIIMFQNIRVPHGAIISDIQLKSSNPDGQIVLAAGTQGSGSTINLFGSRTISVAIGTGFSVFTIAGAQTVSVSDDSVERFQTFAVRVDGQTSATASASIQAIVQYYCP